tara:strand:+ start:464 stop:703 length:240 start_codon:yes stop_codon:yes gene_type:complete
MAYTASNTFAPINAAALNIRGIIVRPFSAVLKFLVMMAEANPRMKEIKKLNNTTDEQLAARGTTRSDEVHRIFNGRYYI